MEINYLIYSAVILNMEVKVAMSEPHHSKNR